MVTWVWDVVFYEKLPQLMMLKLWLCLYKWWPIRAAVISVSSSSIDRVKPPIEETVNYLRSFLDLLQYEDSLSIIK